MMSHKHQTSSAISEQTWDETALSKEEIVPIIAVVRVKEDTYLLYLLLLQVIITRNSYPSSLFTQRAAAIDASLKVARDGEERGREEMGRREMG
jgi:hypothetical protein